MTTTPSSQVGCMAWVTSLLAEPHSQFYCLGFAACLVACLPECCRLSPPLPHCSRGAWWQRGSLWGIQLASPCHSSCVITACPRVDQPRAGWAGILPGPGERCACCHGRGASEVSPGCLVAWQTGRRTPGTPTGSGFWAVGTVPTHPPPLPAACCSWHDTPPDWVEQQRPGN